MKRFYSILILFCTILTLSSCEKVEVNEELLEGSWISYKVLFNGGESSQYSESLDYSRNIYLATDKSFNRDYLTGSWSVTEDQLTLHMEDYYQIPDWTFTVIHQTPNELWLRIVLTEAEYCCDFEEFESDEDIIIVEKYNRVNY